MSVQGEDRPEPSVVARDERVSPDKPVPDQGVRSSRTRRLVIAGTVAGALVPAALVSGLILNVQFNQRMKEQSRRFDRDAYQSAQGYKTAAWICYGVGAASLVGGAVLYGLAWRAQRDGEVTLAPALATDFSGAVLRGSY